MDGMLDDLQYLPPDKERETDADIRKMLLEALFRLCATRPAREILRKVKVYPILRYNVHHHMSTHTHARAHAHAHIRFITPR